MWLDVAATDGGLAVTQAAADTVLACLRCRWLSGLFFVSALMLCTALLPLVVAVAVDMHELAVLDRLTVIVQQPCWTPIVTLIVQLLSCVCRTAVLHQIQHGVHVAVGLCQLQVKS